MTPNNATRTWLIHKFFICEWQHTRVSVAEPHHFSLTFRCCVCELMLMAHHNRVLHIQLHSLPRYRCKSIVPSESALNYKALVARMLDTLRLLQELNVDQLFGPPPPHFAYSEQAGS